MSELERPATLATAAGAILTALFFILPANPAVQAAPVNQDESQVPVYTLPDPLTMEPGGEPVTNASQWFQVRRPQLLDTFTREVYGYPAPPPSTPRWHVLTEDAAALEGRATRREIALDLDDSGNTRVLHFVVFLPNARPKPVPVFVGLHVFDTSRPYPEPAVERRVTSPVAASNRIAAGSASIGQQIANLILARGYALASVDIDPLCPDSSTNWSHGLLHLQGRRGDQPPGPKETGALGVWAWGLSRTVDYFSTTLELDARRVIAIGHSRMGKAALWAGAVDERFAAVISNNSGCGGAALSQRCFGETVAIITRAFPHWFCGNFSRYANHESDLPIDQHELLALIAPRPLYVASAQDDDWSDPRGEFLSAWHASAVYRLLGVTGLDPSSAELPAADTPVGDVVHYHLRRGQHDLTDYDWRQYLDFADRYVGEGRRSAPASN